MILSFECEGICMYLVLCGREEEKEKTESSQYPDRFSIQSFWDYGQMDKPPECLEIFLYFFMLSFMHCLWSGKVNTIFRGSDLEC